MGSGDGLSLTITLAGLPCGLDCHYLPCGETGVKIYSETYKRDRSYNNQFYLWCNGLAPRPMHKATVNIDGIGYPAFETEAAETVKLENGAISDKVAQIERFKVFVQEVTIKLAALAKEHGVTIKWVDSHVGNVGLVGGQPVIIDCADHDLIG